MKSAPRNLHVPLSADMYQRLRTISDRSHRPATELAREAIDRWLAQAERAALHAAIVEYARAVAGSAEDLDLGLEAAGIEHLQSGREVQMPEKRRRK